MNRVLKTVLSLAVAGLLASGANAADEKYNLNLSLQMAPDHTLTAVSQKFADLVKERTKGNVQIKVHPSGALGGEKDNAASLKTGVLDLGIIAVEFYPSFVPESAVLVLPFMYKDYPHVDRILNSDVAKDISKMILDKTDVHVLAYLPMAFRQMFTADKAINTLADLKNLKMRVPESPIYVAAFKQLGAAPTPLAFGEIYAGLQTGVVKGVENTPEAVTTSSFNEVTKYMNITNHIEGPSTISMSEKVFKKMPKEYQDALVSSAIDAAKFDMELTLQRDKIAMDKLKTTMTVVNTDVASLKSAIKYDQIDLVNTEKGRDLIKRMQAIK
jgi:tripartite ATP-independent transporter DctP family solute receptor